MKPKFNTVNLKNFLSRRINIHFPFTTNGLIVAALTVALIVNFRNQHLALLKTYGRMVKDNGQHVSWLEDLDFSYNFPAFFLQSFFVLYFLMVFTCDCWLWFRLKKIIGKKIIKIDDQNQQLQLNFAQPLKLGFFLLKAKLEVYHQNSSHNLNVCDLLTCYLQDDHFVFDFSQLPTGHYQIKQLTFFIEDPLHINRIAVSAKNIVAEFYNYKQSQRPSNAVFSAVDQPSLSENLDFKQGAENDFFKIRQYQAGDELRYIHWKKTAQTNQLLTREAESISIEKKDYALILNSYSPLLKEVNQSIYVGYFMDKILQTVSAILTEKPKSLTIYINSVDTATSTTATSMKMIKNAHQMSWQKLTHLIVEKVIFQSELNLTEYLSKIALPPQNTAIILTLPTDQSLVNLSAKKVLKTFDLKQFRPKLNWMSVKKTIFYSKQSENELSLVAMIEICFFWRWLIKRTNQNKFWAEVNKIANNLQPVYTRQVRPQ